MAKPTLLLKDVHIMPNHPELCIMSPGTLMQSNENMTLFGRASHLALLENGEEFIRFRPSFQGATTYVVWDLHDENCGTPVANLQLSFETAHRRFAHPSREVLRRFKQKTIDCPDFNLKPSLKSPCTGCAQGKMTQRTFPPSQRRATHAWQLIHSDLKSFPVESYYRNKYIITFYDDYSSTAAVVFIKQKSQAIKAAEKFLAHVETKYNAKVKQWMSDAGGEYKSTAFDEMLERRGIEILTSTPHTPQQNGRAERLNRTIMDKAEAMRFTSCLPQSYWEFAVRHAVMIYIRKTTLSLGTLGKVPKAAKALRTRPFLRHVGGLRLSFCLG